MLLWTYKDESVRKDEAEPMLCQVAWIDSMGHGWDGTQEHKANEEAEESEKENCNIFIGNPNTHMSSADVSKAL